MRTCSFSRLESLLSPWAAAVTGDVQPLGLLGHVLHTPSARARGTTLDLPSDQITNGYMAQMTQRYD